MLKHLQKSVEEEELVWKSKMANSEEQLKEVCGSLTFGHAQSDSVWDVALPFVTLTGFAESQQAGSRKPKCRTGWFFLL